MQIIRANCESMELGLVLHTLPVSEAINQVIVYQAGGLQVGIEGGGAKELKSPLFYILCDGI